MSGAEATAAPRDERAQRTARLSVVSDVLAETTRFFHDEGFTQLLPVMLGRSTDPLGPDPGSSVLTTTEIDYLGQRFYLMNSMILHKQVAARDVGKIWILSPNVRLERGERGRSGRHLFEFTQADFEVPGARGPEIRALVERGLTRVASTVRSHPGFSELGVDPPVLRPPWPVYSTHELGERYGEEWELAASRDHDQPFWALCHRREFYDREDPADPGHYLNYDLVYPDGFGEGLSGAEREFEPERIQARLGRDGMAPAAFRAYLEVGHDLVPSAGGGFGIERLARYLLRAPHVGDVQLFRRVPGEPTPL